MLGRLLDSGMNIARLNMSHGTAEWVQRVTRDLRHAAGERQLPLGIMMDTQGPSIRTGDLATSLDLQPGQKFTFTVRGERSEEVHSVDVNYEKFVDDISPGDIVLLDNGAIRMKVLQKFANKIECEVLTEGTLGSRRHINLPGVRVSLPSMTAKDLTDVRTGLEAGVDYIALSFVREGRDIQELRKITSQGPVKPLIVAKIEDQQAVKNLQEIIEESDAVMVARGDLGIECPYEELPIIQRKTVKACLRLGRPVIVATHMLESMIGSPMPTRAEITDVANAVFEQSDGIMLSGETTVGRYPLECLEVFDKIARRIERSGGANYQDKAIFTDPRQKLVKSAVIMADQLNAAAILVFTVHGTMARYTAWMRPRHSPIFAVCGSETVARSLTLNWGVTPIVVKFHSAPEKTIQSALDLLVAKGFLEKGQTTVVISSISAGISTVDAVQMRTVQ